MTDGASVHAFAADAQGRDLCGAVHARVTDSFARYRYGAAADQALHLRTAAHAESRQPAVKPHVLSPSSIFNASVNAAGSSDLKGSSGRNSTTKAAPTSHKLPVSGGRLMLPEVRPLSACIS